MTLANPTAGGGAETPKGANFAESIVLIRVMPGVVPGIHAMKGTTS